MLSGICFSGSAEKTKRRSLYCWSFLFKLVALVCFMLVESNPGKYVGMDNDHSCALVLGRFYPREPLSYTHINIWASLLCNTLVTI